MKKNKWKKILSLFLAFYISMSAFPVLVAGKGDEPENLYALSAALIDGESGRVLYEKNGEEKRPMASTTKIMTCILTLESGEDAKGTFRSFGGREVLCKGFVVFSDAGKP